MVVDDAEERLVAPLELGAAASTALIASEQDPTTAGFFYSRRNTIYYEWRAFLRLGGDDASVQASYEFLQDGHYYSLHTFGLNALMRL